MSRFSEYQGVSRSRKRMSWPRWERARTRPRKLVACPFPQEEVMESPRMTMRFAGTGLSRRCLFRGGGGSAEREDLFHLAGAVGVGVLAEDSGEGGVADLGGAGGGEGAKVGGDIFAGAGGEAFAA